MRSLRVTLSVTECWFTHSLHRGHWNVAEGLLPLRLTTLVALETSWSTQYWQRVCPQGIDIGALDSERLLKHTGHSHALRPSRASI